MRSRCTTLHPAVTFLSFAPNEFKLFEERCKTKWLLQERGVLRKLCFRKSFRISRHVDDLHFRMSPGYAPRQFRPAQSRHDDVRQQDVQLTLVLPRQLQRLGRGF